MSKKKQRLNMLRLPEVCARVGLSKPTIYRLQKLGKFPKSRQLGERAVGWFDRDIDKFLESRRPTA